MDKLRIEVKPFMKDSDAVSRLLYAPLEKDINMPVIWPLLFVFLTFEANDYI